MSHTKRRLATQLKDVYCNPLYSEMRKERQPTTGEDAGFRTDNELGAQPHYWYDTNVDSSRSECMISDPAEAVYLDQDSARAGDLLLPLIPDSAKIRVLC